MLWRDILLSIITFGMGMSAGYNTDAWWHLVIGFAIFAGVLTINKIWEDTLK